MHFHLPKPLHGWRAFIGEVGIIVLGVLIALSAGEIVEALHWRAEVAEARRAMAVELSDSIGQSYERARLSPCIEHRLDEISAVLREASRTNRLPPVGMIGRALHRTWVTSAWQTTISGQTASHFSRHELNQIGYIYDYVGRASRGSDEELLAWIDLQSVSGPGRSTSPEEIAQLIRDVERARAWDFYIYSISTHVREIARQVPLPYDQQTIKESSYDPRVPNYCDSIRDVPAEYGHSSYQGAAEYVRLKPTNIH
jgi:hypothetical protein